VRLPQIEGRIERQLLVNYRVDPEAIARVLPEPFRPQLVGDAAIAGICLIRLGDMRPLRFPRWMGLTSENAAHRVAVEWDTATDRQTGVYIPRRDSDSWVNIALGGRIYPASTTGPGSRSRRATSTCAWPTPPGTVPLRWTCRCTSPSS
jgi:Uncharacterized conserved protein (COG2071)